MRSFIVCSRDGADQAAERLSRALRLQATREGWRTDDLSPVAWVGETGAIPMPRRSRDGWTVLGDAFERPGAPSSDRSNDTTEASGLSRDVWGRYVAVKLSTDGRPSDVFRDPSGALDCIVWMAHGLTFIASDTPDWLVRAMRPSWRINFDRVAAALKNPILTTASLLLDGPIAVLPGERLTIAGKALQTVWRPGDIAAAPLQISDKSAAWMMQQTVQDTVSALAGVGGVIAAEVSGGFDSSVVAACLTRADKAQVRLWLNAYGPDPASDERPFVDALARRLAISPTYADRGDAPLSEAWLRLMPHGVRPSLAALDGPHDFDWAERMRTATIQTLFTGKGGDGLFIQPMTGPVFTDLWRDHGWIALTGSALPAIARRTERSVWTLLGAAIANRPVTATKDDTPDDLVNATDAPILHPWLTDLHGLGPAKIHQILSVIHGQTVYGPSLKTTLVEAVHPLLAQPVVELCLALPTYQLTLGKRDRALARLAFADHLPALITERRSKGELSGYFGRMIADGLDVVRPWLLDGRLAANSVINAEAFEQLLRRDSLAWRGGYVEILTAIAFEGWVRTWEDRLRFAPVPH